MKRVTESQFVSDYGFKSGVFFVDREGNLTAKSINITDLEPTDPGLISNFQITDDSSGNFVFQNISGINPDIELTKSRTFIIELNLTNTGIFFLRQDQTTLYTQNLIHSSGDQGIDAQGKQSGTISITVPSTFTETEIFYSNQSRSIFGKINILDPIGSFSNLTVRSIDDSNDLNSGSLVVFGGAAIAKTLRVGEVVNTTQVHSDSVLTLTSENQIQISVNSIPIGSINEDGLQINQINNTTIGSIIPAEATFTNLSFDNGIVSNEPTSSNNVTNKKYVDNTISALAIALGI